MAIEINHDFGVPVILDEEPASNGVISIGILIKSGSCRETQDNSGISHMIEHLLFAGFKDYRSSDIMFMAEFAGGSINASTFKEYTLLYARGIACEGVNLLNLLLGICFTANFDLSAFEKEREVVLSEISGVEDDPYEILDRSIEGNLFANHPLSLSVCGEKSSVSSLTFEEVSSYYQKHFVPQNSVISVCGDFLADEVLRAVGDFFAQIPNVAPAPFVNPGVVYGKFHEVIREDVEQSYVGLIWPGLSCLSERKLSLSAGEIIFSGGMSSRLFQMVREELALCYDIEGIVRTYLPGGYAGVFYASDHDRALRIEEVVLSEIAKVLKDGFLEKEHKLAINQMRFSINLLRSNLEERMMFNGLLYANEERVLDYAAQQSEVDALKLDDINSVFYDIFSGEYSVCKVCK